MSRRVLVLCVAALAAGVSTTGAFAAGHVQLTEATATFPERSFVLTLPEGKKLDRHTVTVLENGRRVSGLSVVPVGTGTPSDFGVVLVIDASDSMRGKPIQAALAAARSFAAQRVGAHEQIALIVFNSRVRVVLPLTTNSAAIKQALAHAPKLAYGTHIFDATAQAVALVRDAHISAGSVVVLSDGADVGSVETEASVSRKARDAHVRVFTVGLRSRFFKPTPLQALARDTGGQFAEGSASKLAGIYRQLGARLANEYLLRYRTLAGLGKRVHVRVLIAGLGTSATALYATPPPPVAPPPPAAPAHGVYRQPLGTRIWSSRVAIVVVSVLCAFLAAVGVVAIVDSIGPRRERVRRRVAEFVPLGKPQSAEPEGTVTGLLLERTERVLGQTAWWARFKRDLQLAQITMPAEQIVVLTFIGAGVLMWLLIAITGSIAISLVALIVPIAVRIVIARKLETLRRAFGNSLPENLMVLASAIRAGHSFVSALTVVSDDAPEPARTEFRRVVAQEQLGVPIEDALREVVERMNSPELEQVALVAALQRDAGGNTAEVLDRVTETIRERAELRRLVRSLTAQGRMSRWIVSALPVALALLILLINPGYMTAMFDSGIGKVLLVIAGVMVISGSLVIRRIINIKV